MNKNKAIKTCGECKHYICGACNKINNTYYLRATNIACILFEPKKPTVFDKITESVGTLADKLVYQRPDGWWVAAIVYDGAKFTHKETAVAATVKELKKAWKENE